MHLRHILGRLADRQDAPGLAYRAPRRRARPGSDASHLAPYVCELGGMEGLTMSKIGDAEDMPSDAPHIVQTIEMAARDLQEYESRAIHRIDLAGESMRRTRGKQTRKG